MADDAFVWLSYVHSTEEIKQQCIFSNDIYSISYSCMSILALHDVYVSSINNIWLCSILYWCVCILLILTIFISCIICMAYMISMICYFLWYDNIAIIVISIVIPDSYAFCIILFANLLWYMMLAHVRIANIVEPYHIWLHTRGAAAKKKKENCASHT